MYSPRPGSASLIKACTLAATRSLPAAAGALHLSAGWAVTAAWKSCTNAANSPTNIANTVSAQGCMHRRHAAAGRLPAAAGALHLAAGLNQSRPAAACTAQVKGLLTPECLRLCRHAAARSLPAAAGAPHISAGRLATATATRLHCTAWQRCDVAPAIAGTLAAELLQHRQALHIAGSGRLLRAPQPVLHAPPRVLQHSQAELAATADHVQAQTPAAPAVHLS